MTEKDSGLRPPGNDPAQLREALRGALYEEGYCEMLLASGELLPPTRAPAPDSWVALAWAALSNPVSSPPAEGESPSLEKQLSEAKETAKSVARVHAERVEALEREAVEAETEVECAIDVLTGGRPPDDFEPVRRDGLLLEACRAAHKLAAAEAKAAALEVDRAAALRGEKQVRELLAAYGPTMERGRTAEARVEALAGLLRRAVVLHQYEPLSGSGNVTPCRACGRFFYQHMRDNEDRGWCHSPADAALESPRPPPEDAFWVAERRCGAAMTPGYYAADPNCGPVVFSIHHAKRFASREEATAWIEQNVRGMYEAREHIIFKPADPALGECVGHLGPPSNTGTPHPRGETCSHWKQLPEKGKEVPPGSRGFAEAIAADAAATPGVASIAGAAPALTDFQRGQEYMRWRVAEVLPAEAGLILRLPLLGDDPHLDVAAVMEKARIATADLAKAALDAERVDSDTMNFRVDSAATALFARLTKPAPPEGSMTDPDHGMGAAPAQLPEAGVHTALPRCSAQHTFGEDLGTGRRSQCVLAAGHPDQLDDNHHLSDDGRWWSVYPPEKPVPEAGGEAEKAREKLLSEEKNSGLRPPGDEGRDE